MINIKELRIGNYVYPKNENGKPSKIGKVLGITGHLVCVEGNNSPYDYHLLEPILITPEIMEKCGFTLIDDKYYSSPNIADKLAIFVDLTGRLYISIVDERFERGYEDIPFNTFAGYLHQLQNVYFTLTGRELEVEL